MFSRGNVKEKGRLLGFHEGSEDGRAVLDQRRREVKGKWAVDMYAGIGYFVFSYAKVGMRVVCWELNPWSVEGLRRGAERNGWSVRVVRGEELRGKVVLGEERITVLEESNEMCGRRMEELGLGEGIVHVNCGFLPTSLASWRTAWEVVDKGEGGWLHLHENVGVEDIEKRREEMQSLFDGWGEDEVRSRVEHVELVKTFAPDVWHCVFDVYVNR